MMESLNHTILSLLLCDARPDDIACANQVLARKILKWVCVGDVVSEETVFLWFSQMLASPQLVARGVAVDCLHLLDPAQLANLVRVLRCEAQVCPRSTRTAIIAQLMMLEREPEVASFVELYYEALKYLYTTLHVRPSSEMQALLFGQRKTSRLAQVSGGVSHLFLATRERQVVSMYVDCTPDVSGVVRAVSLALAHVLSSQDELMVELYSASQEVMRWRPVESSLAGWRELLSGVMFTRRPDVQELCRHVRLSAMNGVGQVVLLMQRATVLPEEEGAWLDALEVAASQTPHSTSVILVIESEVVSVAQREHVLLLKASMKERSFMDAMRYVVSVACEN